MRCPNCRERTRVVDTRPIDGRVKRYRRCKSCHLRFVTWEIAKDA